MNKLIPVLLGSSLLIPGASFAVGLGAIKINSALNQPLDANIRLLSLRGVQMENVLVVLASQNEHERMGIRSSAMMERLFFKVTRDKNNKVIIHISSREPITDPYLQLVLDVRWPHGQLTRGYNILLDPPDYSFLVKPLKRPRPEFTDSSQAKKIETADSLLSQSAEEQGFSPTAKMEASKNQGNAVTALQSSTQPVLSAKHIAQTGSKKKQATASPSSKTAATSELTSLGNHLLPHHASQRQAGTPSLGPTTKSSVASANTGSQYGPITHADNLWHVAHKVRPSKAYSLDRTMVAILKNNPNSFVNGNINQLKTGSYLTIPTQNNINEITEKSAEDLVNTHVKYWRRGEHIPDKELARLQAELKVDRLRKLHDEIEAKSFSASASTTGHQEQVAARAKPLAQSTTKRSQKSVSRMSGFEYLRAQLNNKPENLRQDLHANGEESGQDRNASLQEASQQGPAPILRHQQRIGDIERLPQKDDVPSGGIGSLQPTSLESEQETRIAESASAYTKNQLKSLSEQNRKTNLLLAEREQEIDELRVQISKAASALSEREKQLSAQAFEIKQSQDGSVAFKLFVSGFIALLLCAGFVFYRREYNVAQLTEVLMDFANNFRLNKAAKIDSEEQSERETGEYTSSIQESKPEIVFTTVESKSSIRAKESGQAALETLEAKSIDDRSSPLQTTIPELTQSTPEQAIDSTDSQEESVIEFSIGSTEGLTIEKNERPSFDLNKADDATQDTATLDSNLDVYHRKLELARVQIKMRDVSEATALLKEVVECGDKEQAQQAEFLLDELSRD